MLRRIPLTDLLNGKYNELVQDHNNPSALNKFSEWFNTECNWAITSIIHADSVHECSDLIQTFITIISKCISLNNLSSAMSLYSALNSGAIQRLSTAWSYVPPKLSKLMSEFDRIFAFRMNFSAYRDLLKNIQPPCIPIFSILARDLTHMEQGSDKYIKSESSSNSNSKIINFERLSGIGYQLIKFRNYQLVPYDFDVRSSHILEKQIRDIRKLEKDLLYAMADDKESKHALDHANKRKKKTSLRDVRESLEALRDKKLTPTNSGNYSSTILGTTDNSQNLSLSVSNDTLSRRVKKRRSKNEVYTISGSSGIDLKNLPSVDKNDTSVPSKNSMRRTIGGSVRAPKPERSKTGSTVNSLFTQTPPESPKLSAIRMARSASSSNLKQ